MQTRVRKKKNRNVRLHFFVQMQKLYTDQFLIEIPVSLKFILSMLSAQ